MGFPNSTTDGRRWVPVPIDCDILSTGSIPGVLLMPDEEVEWSIVYTSDLKKLVTGYKIKKAIKQTTRRTL